MAYTAVTPVVSSLAGTDVAAALAAPALAGAGNGDSVPAGCFLLIKAGATPTVLTLKNSGGTLDGSAVADRTFSLSATTNYLLGPLTNDMRQTTGTTAGTVLIDYSSVATVTRMYIASS